MSSKIEVSREQLERWTTGRISLSHLEEIRALLAAAVVERCTSCDDSGDLIDFTGEWRGYCACPYGEALKKKPAAPPELAELQAAIAQLQAEIERLKGGQREPVYQLATRMDSTKEAWFDVTPEIQKEYEQRGEPWVTRTLYASQPAPVSVPDGWKLVPIEPTELMIRRGDQNYSWSVAKIYAAMIADAPACLDKVKELNQ